MKINFLILISLLIIVQISSRELQKKHVLKKQEQKRLKKRTQTSKKKAGEDDEGCGTDDVSVSLDKLLARLRNAETGMGEIAKLQNIVFPAPPVVQQPTPAVQQPTPAVQGANKPSRSRFNKKNLKRQNQIHKNLQNKRKNLV